jgi:hypothetical protein
MENRPTIVLVLRSGGDFAFRDVELITRHINNKWQSSISPRIVCLWDKASHEYDLGNIEFIPLTNEYRGTWSRIQLYSPEMEKYKPFLYIDLDTAVIQSLEKIFELVIDQSKFITLEDFWQKGLLATGLVWFPANCEKTKLVWKAWNTSNKVQGFRMDRFLRSVTTSDMFWQQLLPSIFDFKPLNGGLLNPLPKEAIIVCFHGKPRIHEIAEASLSIDWVKDYVTEKKPKINLQEAFVINLDSREDRLQEFQKQDTPFPIPIVRFSAITGTPGSKGCLKSHVEILKQEHKFPFIIFEDDCLMIEKWDIVEQSFEQLPEDWDMLYLGAHLRTSVSRYSKNLLRLRGGKTTHAIVYGSQQVVDFILNNIQENMVIDRFYMEQIQPKFNCFITYPMVATQRASHSDITGGFRNYQPLFEKRYNKSLV